MSLIVLAVGAAPALAVGKPKPHHHHQPPPTQHKPAPKPAPPPPAPAPAPTPTTTPAYTPPPVAAPRTTTTSHRASKPPAKHKPVHRLPAPKPTKPKPTTTTPPHRTSAPITSQSSGNSSATLIPGIVLLLAAGLALTVVTTKVMRARRVAAGDYGPLGEAGYTLSRRQRLRMAGGRVRLGLAERPRPFDTGDSGLGRSERGRVYSDRLRVALDEHGLQAVIVVIGLAAAVTVGALVGGL